MTGFCGLERDLDGFFVAHLADQDNFRRLPQGGTQSERKAWSVTVQFALVNRRALVLVQESMGSSIVRM